MLIWKQLYKNEKKSEKSLYNKHNSILYAREDREENLWM